MFADYNPRRIKGHDYEELRWSIRTFGYVQVVVANKRTRAKGWPAGSKPTIVGGHQGVRAAEEEGLRELPIRWIDVDPVLERKLNLALNRVHGEFVTERVENLLRELREGGDPLDHVGFTDEEIDRFLADDANEGNRPLPPGTEPSKRPKSKRGGIYELGEHRLLCGDSTDPGQRSRILEGVSGYVTILDPPFEMPESVWTRLVGDPCILFGQAKHIRAIPERLWRFERVLDKQTPHRSSTTHIGHQHAFVCQLGTAKTKPRGRRTFPSIVRREDWEEHPHEKPAELIAEHLAQWTPPGPVVDWFAGSGSSLLAAALAGRRWYGIEVDPGYCDVIRRRWEEFCESDPSAI